LGCCARVFLLLAAAVCVPCIALPCRFFSHCFRVCCVFVLLLLAAWCVCVCARACMCVCVSHHFQTRI
jgi:hypothetical protein